MSAPDLSQPGIWTLLFPHALTLMAHLEKQTTRPHWTFGGGTVLMLRIGHRQSKDIDLFVPDPQYLGYVNPRLSDVADRDVIAAEFDAIDVIGFKRNFAECLEQARDIIAPLLAGPTRTRR